MSKTLPIYQIDAFTTEIFGGNPAAVCPLEHWLPDETLQKIASENNLSETAFFLPDGNKYHLRWFTPAAEVKLCGHATLAASYVIFECLKLETDTIIFTGLSGDLTIHKTSNGYTLDFPVWEATPVPPDPRITDAFGKAPLELFHGYDWIAVFENSNDVRDLNPDMAALAKIEGCRGIVATATGYDDYDFVSRAFFPAIGVPEDPVTGSAHCILTPLWAEKLGKTSFKARQISPRGGDLFCELKNQRVKITGNAALYMKGTINV